MNQQNNADNKIYRIYILVQEDKYYWTYSMLYYKIENKSLGIHNMDIALLNLQNDYQRNMNGFKSTQT
jgi:hypothetical protein